MKHIPPVHREAIQVGRAAVRSWRSFHSKNDFVAVYTKHNRGNCGSGTLSLLNKVDTYRDVVSVRSGSPAGQSRVNITQTSDRHCGQCQGKLEPEGYDRRIRVVAQCFPEISEVDESAEPEYRACSTSFYALSQKGKRSKKCALAGTVAPDKQGEKFNIHPTRVGQGPQVFHAYSVYDLYPSSSPGCCWLHTTRLRKQVARVRVALTMPGKRRETVRISSTNVVPV